MKKSILIFIISLIFISCNSDSVSQQKTHELDGEWSLISVSCVCPPIYLDGGEHIWTINIANNSVNVVSNVTEYPNRIPETGTYEFLVVNNLVETQNLQYEYSISDSGLMTLQNPIGADFPLLVFTRE